MSNIQWRPNRAAARRGRPVQFESMDLIHPRDKPVGVWEPEDKLGMFSSIGGFVRGVWAPDVGQNGLDWAGSGG